MRALLDTNLLLDALLARNPFVHEAARLFALAEHRTFTGVVSAISLPTIHYVLARSRDTATAEQGIVHLLRLFEVAPVGRAELAPSPSFRDYEDGVVHASAVSSQADGLVTRDAEGFRGASLPVYSPAEFLAALSAA